jgi:4-aminobutyrate aminotransferase-like enzyme
MRQLRGKGPFTGVAFSDDTQNRDERETANAYWLE